MVDATYGDPRLPERYWTKVYPCPITGCWLWGGANVEKGYGIITGIKGSQYAHRIMFAAVNGFLPDHVCHSCDTPWCVNPDHLFPGDAAINNADMRRKGRHGRGERARAAVLTDATVAEIIRMKNTDVSQYAVADRFGVTQTTISMIWSGRIWKHLHADGEIAAIVGAKTRVSRSPACGRGHLFTPQNTRVRPNGTRNCRSCAHEDYLTRKSRS